jgi:hypothetical protein
VNRQDIQKWCNQKLSIEEQLWIFFLTLIIDWHFRNSSSTSTPGKRLKGGGRPLKDGEFDEKVINWVREQRHKKMRVSRKMIQKQALVFSTIEDFKV